MSKAKTLKVGLFVEGSEPTDALRHDFTAMWETLARHCGHDIEIKVIGISKKSILSLRPKDLPPRAGATDFVKRRPTQLIGSAEPLDVVIQREQEAENFDRVVIAFDRWPLNQFLTPGQKNIGCPMRPEVRFVVRFLAESTKLTSVFRDAARELMPRYLSKGILQPRELLGTLEIVFMDPEFEALFVADEATVKKALGIDKKKDRPHGWKAFPRDPDDAGKAVLDRAILATTKLRGAYTSAPARYGRMFVAAARADAKLWAHPIVERLCRALGG